MATWSSDNVILTEIGQQILSKVQAGVGAITVTRIVTGGTIIPYAQLYKATSIPDIKQECTIISVNTDMKGSEISVSVSNEALEESYSLYTLGIYVTHPDFDGEQLYLVAECDTSNPDIVPIPSVTAVTLYYSLYMVHSETSNVVIAVNPDGFVPVNRKVNGYSLTNDVVLTGVDIKTSTTDETTIAAALSNKVPIINHGDTNVSLLDHSLSDGLHVCSDWADCPPGLTDSQGTCFVITYLHYEDLNQYWGRRIYFPTNDRGVYINECVVSTWIGWKQISTATPPQEYDIPLADGWEYTHTWDKNCYLKTQENVVIVNFNAENNNVSVQAGNDYTMGYLPAGFRPNKPVIGVCGDYNYAGNSMYQFWILATGAIVIHSPDKAPIAASGTAVFVANG